MSQQRVELSEGERLVLYELHKTGRVRSTTDLNRLWLVSLKAMLLVVEVDDDVWELTARGASMVGKRP